MHKRSGWSKFAFNIYNGGSIPIPQNSIKVESLDGLNLQTTNPEIQPSSIGRVISVHLGDTESKNLKVEILYKDIIAKYIVNC